MQYSVHLKKMANLRGTQLYLALAVLSFGMGFVDCVAQDLGAPDIEARSAASTETTAQEKPPQQNNQLPKSLEAVREHKPLVRRVEPNTIYLLDEEGNAQPFLDVPYEKFMKLWQESQQADSVRELGYTIDVVDIRGRSLQSHCELRVTMMFTLLSEETVAIPVADAAGTAQSKISTRSRRDNTAPCL